MKKILLSILFFIMPSILLISQTYMNRLSIVNPKLSLSLFEEDEYSFRNNGYVYILAYDINNDTINRPNSYHMIKRSDTLCRDFLLYKRKIGSNDKWEVASDIIQTDKLYSSPPDKNGRISSISEFLIKKITSGYVYNLKNKCVVMLLHNEYNSINTRSINYRTIIILAPDENNNYKSTRFEPKNKLDKRNNHFVTDNVKITDNYDNIILNIFNYKITNNSMSDTFLIVNGKKILANFNKVGNIKIIFKDNNIRLDSDLNMVKNK